MDNNVEGKVTYINDTGNEEEVINFDLKDAEKINLIVAGRKFGSIMFTLARVGDRIVALLPGESTSYNADEPYSSKPSGSIITLKQL